MMIIRETEKYDELARLFLDNGLEIDLEEFPPGGLIRCWEAVSEEEKRMGAIVLEERDGEFIVGDIVVDPSCRHLDVGT